MILSLINHLEAELRVDQDNKSLLIGEGLGWGHWSWFLRWLNVYISVFDFEKISNSAED